jgi:hypothetical protein
VAGIANDGYRSLIAGIDFHPGGVRSECHHFSSVASVLVRSNGASKFQPPAELFPQLCSQLMAATENYNQNFAVI